MNREDNVLDSLVDRKTTALCQRDTRLTSEESRRIHQSGSVCVKGMCSIEVNGVIKGERFDSFVRFVSEGSLKQSCYTGSRRRPFPMQLNH